LTIRTKNGTFIVKIITVKFFKSESGKEPVREWLLTFSKEDKRIIGTDIKTVEFGWPLGMPICKPLGDRLYEVRSHLSSNKIARVLFTLQDNEMILLHAFIKKTQKTPDNELELARKRLRSLKNAK
jgi:phage-related protein